MTKRKYTMSPRAYEVRKAASAKAVETRPAGKRWHTVSVDADTLAAIDSTRTDGESISSAIRRRFTAQ